VVRHPLHPQAIGDRRATGRLTVIAMLRGAAIEARSKFLKRCLHFSAHYSIVEEKGFNPDIFRPSTAKSDGCMKDRFYEDARYPWSDVEPGIRRKIVGHTPNLLAAVVRFDKGAVGTPHGHADHEQIAYVLAGAFEVEVAGEKRVLRAGDAFIADKNVRHGVVALEPNSRLLDIFSPRRDDFIG
jgi:quercetin dioxygenase-like cupin family protein